MTSPVELACKTSTLLSEGRYGIEELQSTLYHLFRKQFLPIPKGNGIKIPPHVSLHPFLLMLLAFVNVVVLVKEIKISRCKTRKTCIFFLTITMEGFEERKLYKSIYVLQGGA